MLRLLRGFLALLLGAWIAAPAGAFTPLGPFEAWQIASIGYRLGGDIGGPLNLGEEYRWNIRTVTYGYDESFLNYFGAEGVAAIEQAVGILNALPPVSQMSTNLDEFPLESRRLNFQASALNLLDLKSAALSLMIEEMGLADPERWTWCLRSRNTFPGFTNYTVIKRNFDPVTLAPSSYVNGTLYTYFITDQQNPQIADAQENLVDPLFPFGTAVASSGFGFGQFYIGLSRDDVGGLRYLWRTNNYNTENLVTGTILTPVLVTNPPPLGSPVGTPPTIITNIAVSQALRPGVDKITFVRAAYDSLLGTFIPQTNTYIDSYVTNSMIVTQAVRRIITGAPEILFAAADVGVVLGVPVLGTRNTAAAPNWINNDNINGRSALAGPGVIQAPGPNSASVTITFNKVGPWRINQNPFFLDELNFVSLGFVWGSFDGSTNPPVVYPIGTSIYDLENQVLNPP